jgi:tripartite-type tricarboxylate transporter receptor subunit TctC
MNDMENFPISRRTLLGSIASTGALVLGGTARADEAYPARRVQLVCGTAAGTGMDSVARILSGEISKTFGQPMFVDNKTGFGGNMGADFVAKSPPDGYTLFIAGSSTVVSSFIVKQMPFRYEDLVPVTLVGYLPLVLVVSSKSRFTSLAALVEAARAQPGKLNFGTSGIGTTNHLAAEQFNRKAKIDTVHVPYKTPVAIDVMSGVLDFAVDAVTSAVPHIKAGKLRALAVTTRERSAVLPDVPTIAELGYPDFDTSIWYAVLVPAHTPSAVVNRLNTEFVKAAHQPEIATRLAGLGLIVRATPPGEAQAFMDAQRRELGTLIKAIGIKPE